MDKKQAKTDNKQKDKQQNKLSVRAMMEAKVPSACYELSEKPPNHTVSKYESG
jgi:hypothetical protein